MNDKECNSGKAVVNGDAHEKISEIAIRLAKSTHGTWSEGIARFPRVQRWGKPDDSDEDTQSDGTTTNSCKENALN